MEERYLKALEKVKKYGQEQLLACYEKLDARGKELLLEDILNTDFNQITELYNDIGKETHTDAKIDAIEYVEKAALSQSDKERYSKLGTEAIKNGEYAVITMAGGQGTRLGHTGPKGTYDIGLPSHKSIFEILTDTMKGYKDQYEVTIPWYIMTSEENNDQTVKFFEDHDYFGYGKENITFFTQGQLPMVDEQGKILLNEQGRIKLAADGHGGIFISMINKGIVNDMKQKGIKWLFVSGVDNILVKPVDDILLGLALDKNVLAGSKSLVKAYPEEKVGVFCRKNGIPSVIEYSEISKEMAEERAENGELKLAESHIVSNLFNVSVIEEMSKNKMRYHVAHKKATYMDENGEIVVPEKPNAYKFEAFIFDAFETVDDLAILRVKREEEFAPIKNAKGEDSPETARELYLNYQNKIKNKEDIER